MKKIKKQITDNLIGNRKNSSFYYTFVAYVKRKERKLN